MLKHFYDHRRLKEPFLKILASVREFKNTYYKWKI